MPASKPKRGEVQLEAMDLYSPELRAQLSKNAKDIIVNLMERPEGTAKMCQFLMDENELIHYHRVILQMLGIFPPALILRAGTLVLTSENRFGYASKFKMKVWLKGSQ